MSTEATEMDEEELDPELEGLDHLDDGEKEGSVTPPPKPEPTDEVKSALAELTRTVTTLAKPKEKEKPAPTQEEIDEYWGVYKPEKADPKFVDKFFRLTEDMPPEQREEFKKLFDAFQNGITRQSVMGAKRLFEAELSKLREEIAPVQQYMSEAKQEKYQNTFYSRYEGLKDPKYAKIITLCATELKDENFKNDNEFFKALAERAGGYIKDIDQSFVLTASQTKKLTGTTLRLPRTSVGGTGGSGGGKSAALSVKGDATDDFLDED